MRIVVQVVCTLITVGFWGYMVFMLFKGFLSNSRFLGGVIRSADTREDKALAEQWQRQRLWNIRMLLSVLIGVPLYFVIITAIARTYAVLSSDKTPITTSLPGK
jgi:hypothetical protein